MDYVIWCHVHRNGKAEYNDVVVSTASDADLPAREREHVAAVAKKYGIDEKEVHVEHRIPAPIYYVLEQVEGLRHVPSTQARSKESKLVPAVNEAALATSAA